MKRDHQGCIVVPPRPQSVVSAAPQAPEPFQLVTDHSRGHINGGGYDVSRLSDTGLDLKYPAIEALPEFLNVIDNRQLLPCCRAFNASICQLASGLLVMAYRVEHWTGMNSIAICHVARGSLAIGASHLLEFRSEEVKGAHWEDPRLAVINGQLLLICAWVKFGAPTICRQRLFLIDDTTFTVMGEINMPYGRALEGLPEKNWMPFETPEGGLAIVYSQRPWMVIENPSHNGHETPGLVGWRMPGKYLSGRTPPVKLPGGTMYLSFFGGHVKHDYRGSRYFMGALIFSADRPYGVIMATSEPLCWGTESSPTLLSSRPASGHPCCIYPAGCVIAGGEVIVSCGVNDSYNVFLRYSLTDLMAKMSPVNAEGQFA